MDSSVENSQVGNKAEREVYLSILMENVLAQQLHITQVEEVLDAETFNMFRQDYLSQLRNKVFRNDVIVEEVMQNLQMKDIKAFRQQSRLCYNTSKRFWLRKAWVHIRYSRENCQHMQEFNEFFGNCLDNPSIGMRVPVQNYTISTSGPPLASPELDKFANLCGSHIKSLALKYSNEYDSDKPTALSRLLEVLSMGSGLHNLKYLRLTLPRSINFSVLINVPALEEFVLTKENNEVHPGDFPNLFSQINLVRAMLKIRKRPKFLSLAKVDMINVPVSNIRDLIKAKFPLTHLALSLHRVGSESELSDVLNHYGGNLKSLKLLNSKLTSFNLFSHVPLNTCFGNLKKLELWRNVVTNLNILKHIPNLVKLTVDYFCFECPHFSIDYDDEPSMFHGDMVRNSSDLLKSRNFHLEKLQKFETDCKLSSNSWNVLTKWMANLRVLEAAIRNNTAFWTVCDNFENLLSLRLRFGSQIDDDGILGGNVVDEKGDQINYRGITNLKYLSTFEYEVECGQARLTDKSAELGFLKLEHLGSLKLGFSGNLISERMEDKLRENIGHVEMYRSCGNITEGTEIQKCCEWAKFKQLWKLG